MKLPTTISLQRKNGIKLSHLSARNCNFITRSGTRVITCRVIYRRTAKPFSIILLYHSFVRIPDAENCPEPAARLLSNDGTEDTSSSNCWHSLDNAQACGLHRLTRNTPPMASLILDNSATHYSSAAPSAAGNWLQCPEEKRSAQGSNHKTGECQEILSNFPFFVALHRAYTILPVCAVYNDRGKFYCLLPLHVW
jgi:hypothetical protein